MNKLVLPLLLAFCSVLAFGSARHDVECNGYTCGDQGPR